MNTESAANTVIIVSKRRRQHGDEGHHGGAWKIAYADFMTAMMAFFLVMWLINMTDDKTIVQVAQYFNPIQLSEKLPSRRGLDDGNNKAGPENNRPGSAVLEPKRSDDEKSSVVSDPLPGEKKSKLRKAQKERALLEDPAKALQDIALKAFEMEQDARGDPRAKPDASSDRSGAWSEAQLSVDSHLEAAATDQARLPTGIRRDNASRIAAEATNISQALRRMRTSLAQPEIEVNATQDGVLITLTDSESFGMFEVSSAEPAPALVRLMERIAKVILPANGRIIVRGHTDGRSYKSAHYDNWRLSSARAQMAYYMLVKGGVPESRFERIEGHADRLLRNAKDKAASENRRIEILLRVD